MKPKIIGNGAEATITLSPEGNVWKFRPKKSYRIPLIDDKIRRLRTRAEGRIMTKASKIVNVPTVHSSDESSTTVVMSFVEGKKLSDFFDSSSKVDCEKICFILAGEVAKLHDAGIVHGDLTSSNIIVDKGQIFFIDFGLSFHSQKSEDKAVDIHLFKQALEARHHKDFPHLYNSFLNGYKKSRNYDLVISQLLKVEARGRYRH